MCQLTFVNFHNKIANRLLLWTQFHINAKSFNKDGVGYFSAGVLWKSGLDVNQISNLSECFSGIKDKPTIGHVRAATSVKGVKTVDNESSHPFDTNKLVLAHNGSLEFKDEKNLDEYKKETVDSMIFLLELDKAYTGNNFVEALRTTIEKFNGPFAFLIYSKLEKRWFAVRGTTKKLNFSLVDIVYDNGEKETSIVINTDKLDLEQGLSKFKAVAEMTIARKVEFQKAEEIKEGKIFEIDVVKNTLVELGEIKETSKPITNFTPPAGVTRNYYNSGTKDTITTSSSAGSLAEKLDKYLLNLELSFLEFDSMLYTVLGKGFFYCSEEEISAFIESTHDILFGMLTKVKVVIWKEIEDSFSDPLIPYQEIKGLKFPFMMNSEKQLRLAWTYVKALEKLG